MLKELLTAGWNLCALIGIGTVISFIACVIVVVFSKPMHINFDNDLTPEEIGKGN